MLFSPIPDVSDFVDENQLASYFGIVPKVAESNQTERRGQITKRGSTDSRHPPAVAPDLPTPDFRTSAPDRVWTADR